MKKGSGNFTEHEAKMTDSDIAGSEYLLQREKRDFRQRVS